MTNTGAGPYLCEQKYAPGADEHPSVGGATSYPVIVSFFLLRSRDRDQCDTPPLGVNVTWCGVPQGPV